MLCRNIGIINKGELVENTSMKALLQKLDMETFVLDLAAPCEVTSVEGIQWRQIDERTLEVDIQKDTGLNAVFAALTAQSIQVISMRNKSNRLEELFVNLVAEQGAKHD